MNFLYAIYCFGKLTLEPRERHEFIVHLKVHVHAQVAFRTVRHLPRRDLLSSMQIVVVAVL